MTHKNESLQPAVLIAPLVALALAYLFYTGLFCSDDTRYLIGIQKITRGEFIDLESIAERRLIFLLPGALAYWLTGAIDTAIAVYSLFYILVPVFVWFCTRRFGVSCAVAASLFAVLAPNLYRFAGTLLPDVLSASIAAAMLALTLAALSVPGKRRAFAFTTGATAMLGVAIKESNAVIAIIPFGLFTLRALLEKDAKGWLHDIVAAVLGVFCVAFGEILLYRIFAGQWHSSLMNEASDHGFLFYTKTQGLYPVERFRYLISQLDAWTLSLFAAALGAIFVLAVMSARRKTMIAWWAWVGPASFFAWPLIYFTIGTSSFSAYIPPVIQVRYYAPCIAPAAVLVALAIRELGERKPVASLLLASCLAFFASGVYFAFGDRGVHYWARAKDAIRLALIDARKASRSPVIVAADSTVNSEVGRCLRLIIADEGLAWTTTDNDRVEAPFFLLGMPQEKLEADNSGFGRRLRQKVSEGEWEVGMVGYYFADANADDGVWWKPRQAAIEDRYASGRSLFHEQTKPGGYIPWMKREMHSEMFLVYPAKAQSE